MPRVIRSSAILLLAPLLLLGIAASASAGPPWISIEFPTNPHHPSTRDAAFLVRLYHHSTSIDVPLTAVAHGLADGKRMTLPLRVAPTNLAGVFAVRGLPEDANGWVAVVTMQESEHASATALVTLGPKGEVVAVNVPSYTTNDGWVVPRNVTDDDIETRVSQAQILAKAYRSMAAPPAQDAAGATLPLMVLISLAPIGLIAARVGRTRRDR
ncbi:MAG: hypothetical protein ACREL7_18095 [Longimicrobiales bacterium]